MPTNNDDGRDGETGYSLLNGRLNIKITLGKKSGFEGVMNVTHESFIHANSYAVDFLDNRTIDYSNLNSYVVNNYRKVNRHHIQTSVFDRREYKGLYANQGFSIMLQANKRYNENKTRTQVWNSMYDYRN
jgi:hypothetical protein